MSNCKYLIQTGSNHVYVSTPELLKRSDMTLYDFEAKGHPAKPVVAPEPVTPPSAPLENPKVAGMETDTKTETLIEKLTTQAKKIDDILDDKPGINTIRTELEAIEDPAEMVTHVFEKYGLKLTRTMRKDTMITRTLEHIGG